MRKLGVVSLLSVGIALGLLFVWKAGAEEASTGGRGPGADPDGGLKPVSTNNTTSQWAPAVKPKALSENIAKGLEWLVRMQRPDGSWGQGEESAQMGKGMEKLAQTPNVADTCMATLALLRSGSTPKAGDHAAQIRKALEFICGEVEKSDEKSLFITDLKGTRTQAKLGAYIDTFMTSMLLAQVRDRMPDEASQKRVAAAFHKVMDKIEKNQRADGTWDGNGWAPVLQQSMAVKAINQAAQSGGQVDEQVRKRSEEFAQGQFERPKSPSEPAKLKSADAGAPAAAGGAGVDLYRYAGNLGAMQDQENTNGAREEELRRELAKTDSADKKKELQATLDRYEENRKQLKDVKAALVQRLEDDRFIQGFGSNGGEEFLSYMNIGEALVVNGGAEWEKWDKKITENLNRIQNQDGSWTGHHCITGRTFCTSAAMLVLMTDRAPVPVGAKIGRR